MDYHKCNMHTSGLNFTAMLMRDREPRREISGNKTGTLLLDLGTDMARVARVLVCKFASYFWYHNIRCVCVIWRGSARTNIPLNSLFAHQQQTFLCRVQRDAGLT